MYHCHLQFYLTGYQNSIFEVIKKTAPLESFNHEFSESDEPDGALAAGADVILANLQGMNAKEALYGENHPETVKGYCNLADLYEKQGAYEKAGQWYHKALPIAKKILGKNHDRTKSISDKLTCLHGN